jgi:hypothetical protein
MTGYSHSWQTGALALGLLALVPHPAQACATCGCTLSADAATGYSSTAGWRLNAEFDFINQDELRSGTHSATAEQVVDRPADPGGESEIEHSTLNRYLTLGLAYSPGASWNLDLRVPYVLRGHDTYGAQDAPFDPSEVGADQLSSARVSGLGDARFIVSYQGLLPTHNLGLQLGIKLPTGHYGDHTLFDSGPLTGEALDASLQAGTGSTDLIAGAYWYQPISQNFDITANAQYQSAFAHRQDEPGNDYRPGNAASASVGLRYEAHPSWIPQLQLNLLHKSADQGALADTTSTAGTVAYLSPGITLMTAQHLFVYGFVQVPVYSNLDGYQLFPHWSASVGLSYAL